MIEIGVFTCASGCRFHNGVWGLIREDVVLMTAGEGSVRAGLVSGLRGFGLWGSCAVVG